MPLQIGTGITASVKRMHAGEEKSHRIEEVHARLVIRPVPHRDTTEYFIATFICEKRFFDDPTKDIRQVTYIPRTGKFSGMVIYSTVEGEFLSGRKYLNGEWVKSYVRHRHEGACDPESRCHRPQVGISFVNRPANTRSGSENQLQWCGYCLTEHGEGICIEEIVVEYCSTCGQPVDRCYGHYLTYCNGCGFVEFMCICGLPCMVCHNEPCTCKDPKEEEEEKNDDDEKGNGDGEKKEEEEEKKDSLTLTLTLTGETKFNLMTPYTVQLEVLPKSTVVSDATVRISGAGASDLVLQDIGSATSFEVTPRTPGHFTLHVTATLNDTIHNFRSKNTIQVEHRFPGYDDLCSNYSGVMDRLWGLTLDNCNSSTCREFGAVFYINTTEHAPSVYQYEERIGVTRPSDLSLGGFIDLTPEDRTYGDIRNGGRYCIGVFHTHPPRTYVPWDMRGVEVGPSEYEGIPADNIPAIVRDYIPTFFDTEGKGVVPTGYFANSPTQLYNYGGTRRSTP